MRKVIFLIVISGLLAGCVALPDLNAGLTQINDNLRKANYRLRNTPGGSGQTVTAEGDEVCDKQAYQVGYSDEYVKNWNLQIASREETYHFLAKSHPDDQVARHNYDLYKGKMLSTEGIGNEMGYGLRFTNTGHILNNCQALSYSEGKKAGFRAAANDLKVLEEQEIEQR